MITADAASLHVFQGVVFQEARDGSQPPPTEHKVVKAALEKEAADEEKEGKDGCDITGEVTGHTCTSFLRGHAKLCFIS